MSVAVKPVRTTIPPPSPRQLNIKRLFWRNKWSAGKGRTQKITAVEAQTRDERKEKFNLTNLKEKSQRLSNSSGARGPFTFRELYMGHFQSEFKRRINNV